MTTLPGKDFKLFCKVDIDYNSIEKQMAGHIAEMQSKLDIQKGSQKVFFDTECGRLSEFSKKMMTRRSSGTNAVAIADSAKLRPVLDKEEITNLMKALRRQIKDIYPSTIPLCCVGLGVGPMLNDFAKQIAKLEFEPNPMMIITNDVRRAAPTVQKVFVLDSFPDITYSREALVQMGQADIRAFKAGVSLRKASAQLKKDNDLQLKNKNEFRKDGDGVSYSKGQANRWANGYSHKRPRKL